MIVAQTRDGKAVTAKDLKADGAMAVLLKDALAPNLVQTLEGSPALVHGGPFANIAHGCNSVMATRLGLKLADVVVTEAGFGADLGAEKFIDIKCRSAGLTPSCAVVVATVRALKMHGGVARNALGPENVAAVKRGVANLRAACREPWKFRAAGGGRRSTTSTRIPRRNSPRSAMRWRRRAWRRSPAPIGRDGSAGAEELARAVVSADRQRQAAVPAAVSAGA